MHLKELPIDGRETTVKIPYPRSVLLRRPFKTAFKPHLPYIFVLRRPFKKAFPTLSMHIPLRRLVKRLSNYPIPTCSL